ncbi:hypothetical protein HGA88_05790 [Candidatus Roizmanbacteria bacterium]|nr:hypothetical protein [Candidatus Roizmanbacteria bacterium]
MNKLTVPVLITLFTVSTLPFAVHAQTKKASTSAVASSSASVEDQDVKALREKVASKVAELRKNQKAVAGNVTDITTLAAGTIKIKTPEDIEYIVKIDDSLTKLFQVVGNSKKEIKKSAVQKNAYLLVTGPLIDKTIQANYVYQDDQYIVKSGKITEVNKDDYYVKVISSDKDNYTLDVQTKSQLVMMNIKTLDQEKVGFSKLKEGDTVHFVVRRTGTETEPNRYSIERMLVIPQEYYQK